jgi:hypothetical protein
MAKERTSRATGGDRVRDGILLFVNIGNVTVVKDYATVVLLEQQICSKSSNTPEWRKCLLDEFMMHEQEVKAEAGGTTPVCINTVGRILSS